MQPRPVFILGLHRSGTTLLYRLLGETGDFHVITARHVAFFDELSRPRLDRGAFEQRVLECFASLGQTDRRIDSVPVGPDTPEEYGFLLERLTGSHALRRTSGGAFRRICETVTHDLGGRRPMLLKNPWDFDRAHIVREVVPGAKFVFIHRNPFHVLSSTLRMVRLALESPNPYLAMLSESYRALLGCDFPWRVVQALGTHASGLIADLVIRDVAARANGFLLTYRKVETRDAVHLRYETLCENANETINRVLRSHGLREGVCDFSTMIAPSRSDVHPEIAKRRGKIVERFGAYGDAFGYDLGRIAEEL